MFRLVVSRTIFCIALFYVPIEVSFAQNTDKLVKEANALFDAQNYIEATPKYLQLLSLEPRNSFYNYRYGACLLFNSEKKPEALKYLKFAVTDSDVDPEAHYFLARAYHLNYYFDRAIKSYLTYKGLVRDKQAMKRDVDRQIEMCRNGQRLMSRINELIVKERKSANFDDFFRQYNLRDIGGSILVAEDFQTKIDRRKGHKPVIHFAEDRDIIFYSSYGEVDAGQKDIYYRKKNERGEWGSPVKLPNVVNSDFDEDYPYLDPNGTYLYFSSKGHNSMGGYDVFRVPINIDEMKFGKLENLDFAISSTDDDLFYVVDREYKHAYFASARQSEGGRIHVYRVMVNKFESNTLFFAGNFISSVNPGAKNITIQIKDLATGRIIDQVKSNPTNGGISFSMPRGGKYEFIVQTENTRTPQVIQYDAPFFEDSRLLKLNFLEEASVNGVQLRISQDDYYQFTEDEKSDALAALFLNKSELLPNVQLLDLLEQNTQVQPDTQFSELMKALSLDKYAPSELSRIATQDLNTLKANFRKSEDQRKVFLQVAADNIEKAQAIEVEMEHLFAKAQERGLSEREVLELRKLDNDRTLALSKAAAANKIAGKLQINSNYIQGDIARADVVSQKMKEVETLQSATPLESLTDAEKTFIKEHFNRIKEYDAAQEIGLADSYARLKQIEFGMSELNNVEREIAEKEKQLSDSRSQLETAPKREKTAIEKKIEEIETELDGLKRQKRFLSRQNEKLAAERDSILTLQEIYAESRNINPSLVQASNNVKLNEAKLNNENAKALSQKTQNLLESVKVIVADDSNQEALLTEQQNAKGSKERERIISNSRLIDDLDKQLAESKNMDFNKKLELELRKFELINEQLELLTQLAAASESPDLIQEEIQAYQLRAEVSDNVLAELRSQNKSLVNENAQFNLSDLAPNNGRDSSMQIKADVNDTQAELSELIPSFRSERFQKYANIQRADQNDIGLLVQKEKEFIELIENQINIIEKLADSTNVSSLAQTELIDLRSQLRTSKERLNSLVQRQELAISLNGIKDTSELQITEQKENSGNFNNEKQKTVVYILAVREIENLKSSNNLGPDINAIDRRSVVNKLRVQRYQNALGELLASHTWDAESKKIIEEEIQLVDRWISGSDALASRSENMNSSSEVPEVHSKEIEQNEKTNPSIFVFGSNNDATKYAEEIAFRRELNETLQTELLNAETRREERKILKQIEKNDAKIIDSQFKLIMEERVEYSTAKESVLKNIDDILKNDPSIKFESLILEQKFNNLNKSVEALQFSNKADRERILAQTMNMRNDFIKQLQTLENQLAIQHEINRISYSSDLDATVFEDARKLDYVLISLNEEVNETQQKIDFLETNLNSYPRFERPQIENKIEQLRQHLDIMLELKRETQRSIQSKQNSASKAQKLPALSNTTVDDQLLLDMTEEDLVNQLNNSDVLSIRNDLVSFKIIETKLLNLMNKQQALRLEMRALINQITTEEEEDIKNNNRQKLNELAKQFKQNQPEIESLTNELNRLHSVLESNPLYSSNPVFFNTLAKSPKIQEALVTSNAKAGQANSAPVQPAGITFINSVNRESKAPNFGLNNVNIPGLIYKIQIGAFNRPVDMNIFAEFDPVTTDQVGNSIRYSAGLFYNKNQAFASLYPIRAMGYKDAFVVAYCDGVRYTVAEADELLRQGKCALNNAGEMAFETATKQTPNESYNKSYNSADALALERTSGLLFTVQIGVYNTPRTTEQMRNLSPLNTQLTERNQIRYSVGRFDNVQDAINQRDKVRELGFSDAFIVAYFNGERISVSDAQRILQIQGELVLYNRQQLRKVEVTDLNLIQITPEEEIQRLNTHEPKFRYISQTSYKSIPKKQILEYRENGIWLSFDETIGRLVSATVDKSSGTYRDNLVLQPVYQGFGVKDTTMLTFQNLEGYQADETYYELTMSWENEFPAFVAVLLNENLNFVVHEWLPEQKKLKFAPLNFVQKERIRKILSYFTSVRFTENVLTF
jgi:hypothetical protein